MKDIMLRILMLFLLLMALPAQGTEDWVWTSKAVSTVPASSYAFDRSGPPTTLTLPPGTTEDAYFTGSAIASNKSVGWTMVGTVPQGTLGQLYPSGFGGAAIGIAGPYTAANHYRTTATNPDAFDFTSTGWSCLLYVPDDSTVGRLWGANNSSTTGWSAYQTTTTRGLSMSMGGAGATSSASTGVGNIGSANVACIGVNGTSSWAKINSGAAGRSAAGASPTASTLATQIGTYGDGSTQPFTGKILRILAGTDAPSEAVFSTIFRQMSGIAPPIQYEGVTSGVTTDRYYSVNGTRYLAPQGWPRINEKGLMLTEAHFQYFASPAAPATQTLSLNSGNTFCAWNEGTGTVAYAVGTATATGLPCTSNATDTGCGCSFTVTGTGTVIATVSGSVSFAQVQTPNIRQDPDPVPFTSGSQYGEVLRLPNTQLGGSAGHACWTFRPVWAASASQHDHVLMSDLPASAPGGTTANLKVWYVSASNVWRFLAGGASVDSAVQSFPPETDIAMCLDYKAGTHPCLTVAGAQTCGASNTTAFVGAPWLIFGQDPTLNLMGYGSNAITGGAAGYLRGITLGPTKGPGAFAKTIIAIGDSITWAKGIAGATVPWVYQVGTAMGTGYWADNQGDPADALTGNIAGQYWRNWHGSLKPGDTVILMAGFNDVNIGKTAAQIEYELRPIYDDVISQGAKMVPMTVTPYSGFSGAKQTERGALNTWILAQCAADPTHMTCVDMAAEMDDGAGGLKAPYNNPDTIHPNQAGNDREAVVTTPAVAGTVCPASITTPCVCGSVVKTSGTCP